MDDTMEDFDDTLLPEEDTGKSVIAGDMLDEIGSACEEPTLVGDGLSGKAYLPSCGSGAPGFFSWRSLLLAFIAPVFAGLMFFLLVFFFSFKKVAGADGFPWFVGALPVSVAASAGMLALLSLAVFRLSFPRVEAAYDFDWFAGAVVVWFAGSVLLRLVRIDMTWYVVLRTLSACIAGVSFALNARNICLSCRALGCGKVSESRVIEFLFQAFTCAAVFTAFFAIFLIAFGFAGFPMPEEDFSAKFPDPSSLEEAGQFPGFEMFAGEEAVQ